MVKTIAEQSGVKMPSFFGYVLWSFAILVPIWLIRQPKDMVETFVIAVIA